MSQIVVGKVYSTLPNHLNIRVDRRSVLGNPFYMANESQREHVCNKYEEYFGKQIQDKSSDVYAEMVRLWRHLQDGHSLHLQCHCAPKRCHADTLKSFLEKHI